MDFFYEILTEGQGRMLLHIEFQTDDDKEMVYRMNEYHAISLRNHKMPIKQVVIFLGKGEAMMRTKLKRKEAFKGFELINLY